MPLLKRKPLQRVSTQECLKDSDEVFVCEATGELFSDYDDYFNRIMLLSSTVWSCAMTGKTNLTYADALESERAAKRLLRSFPAVLKGPVLLIASRTKRTGIMELACDVHGYAKDVFFKGETVYTRTDELAKVRKGKIVQVVVNERPSDHQSPDRLIYHVVSDDNKMPASYTVRGDAVTRKRNRLSREMCKLFLKQHVELGENQVLCVKKESLEQFVTSTGCTDETVFYGQMPDFGMSKKLLLKEKKDSEKEKKVKKQEEKKVKREEEKNEKRKKVSVGKKQHSIVDYMQATPEDLEAIQQKKLKRAKQKVLARKRKTAEKALLLPYVATALKEYSTIREDQELTDQRVLPSARPLQTKIGEEHFSSFMVILEFLHQYGDMLSIEQKFPNGVTIEVLERALVEKAVNGPLNDIFQVLLRTLSTNMKEMVEMEDSYIPPSMNRVMRWCQNNLSTKLTDLPMDSTTVTEVLRLHLVAFSQPSQAGDPCFMLIRENPHLMRTLTMKSIFQLPINILLQIMSALIHQLLHMEEVLVRVFNIREARQKLIQNRNERHRLAQRTASLKQMVQESMNRELSSLQADPQPPDSDAMEEAQKKIQQKLQEEFAQIDANANEKLAELMEKYKDMKKMYGISPGYLGSDRAYRRYWMFESLPGLYVEQDQNCVGNCGEHVTVNLHSLAQCNPKQRRRYITYAILQCVRDSPSLPTNGSNTRAEVDIAVQLLIRGMSLLEKAVNNKRIQDLLAKAGARSGEVENTVATDLKMDIDEVANGPPAKNVHPTNRELLMCTGKKEDCPVHNVEQRATTTWGYYATADEIDALIASLNIRGIREKSLRHTLELCRYEIVEQIEKCPIKSLSYSQASLDAPNSTQGMRKVSNIPLQQQPEAVTNEMLELMFRDHLLALEERITVGCLGELKVQSIEKWREAILNRSYDAQIAGQLQWGARRLKKLEELYHYAKENMHQDLSSKEEDSDLEGMADEQNVVKLRAKDPGYDLIATQMQTDEKLNKVSLAEELESIQRTVHPLACALLQIAQGVDPKFLRHPFGPTHHMKDRSTILHHQFIGQKKLLHWESSLMRATSFSQLFLHYHILYDALCWSRSIERAVCMSCRRKGDPNLTLLCDECNRACHTYCLKPMLKKVPEGDWFCAICRPEDHELPKRTRKQTKVIEEMEVYSDADSSPEDSDDQRYDDGEEDESSGSVDDRASESDESDEEFTLEEPKFVVKKQSKKDKSKEKKAAAKQALSVHPSVAVRKHKMNRTKKSNRNLAKRMRFPDGGESSEKGPQVAEGRSGRRSLRLSGRGGEM